MNIGLLVPQVYYDLIARILPGLTILASSFFIWKGESITAQDIFAVLSWFTSKGSHSIFTLFSFLIISYMLSLILDGLGKCLEHIEILSKKFLKRGYDDIKKEALNDFRKIKPIRLPYEFPGTAIMYDIIRMKKPELGARLVKLRAEFHMCRILILGWFIFLIINLIIIIYNFPNNSYLRPLIEISLLLAIIAAYNTYTHLRERYLWGLCNHWLLIEKYEKKTR